MPETGKVSEYLNELTAEPADDDLFDVTVLISTAPDVWQSQKMRYEEIKNASEGVAITADIIPVGDGSGIVDGQFKSGTLDGDEGYFAHKNWFTVDDYLIYHDANDGSGWFNSPEYLTFIVGQTIMDLTSDGAELAKGNSAMTVKIGNSISNDTGAKVLIHAETADDTKYALDITQNDVPETLIFRVRNDGLFFLKNGAGVNEFSTDGTLAGDSDDAVPTEKAVKTYVDAQSVGGWLGSETRIKIAPWDVVSYNDKDGVSIQDDGGVVNDAAAKITTMVTGVFIPTGYRATAFMINASANIAVELFESQIDDSTAVSKGSGNANTEVNITNVDSTTTNYLSIIIVEAGNDIYGGYITIEKI